MKKITLLIILFLIIFMIGFGFYLTEQNRLENLLGKCYIIDNQKFTITNVSNIPSEAFIIEC